MWTRILNCGTRLKMTNIFQLHPLGKVVRLSALSTCVLVCCRNSTVYDRAWLGLISILRVMVLRLTNWIMSYVHLSRDRCVNVSTICKFKINWAYWNIKVNSRQAHIVRLQRHCLGQRPVQRSALYLLKLVMQTFSQINWWRLNVLPTDSGH